MLKISKVVIDLKETLGVDYKYHNVANIDNFYTCNNVASILFLNSETFK